MCKRRRRFPIFFLLFTSASLTNRIDYPGKEKEEEEEEKQPISFAFDRIYKHISSLSNCVFVFFFQEVI